MIVRGVVMLMAGLSGGVFGRFAFAALLGFVEFALFPGVEDVKCFGYRTGYAGLVTGLWGFVF